MRIDIPLENGMLPDRFGKHAPDAYVLEGRPIRSFPFTIDDTPASAHSFAFTFLDWDSIPVAGFSWIHWIACNVAPNTRLVPENASITEELAMVQGSNSEMSRLAGACTDPRIIHRYVGPCPPDRDHLYTLTVYALDKELDLAEGFYLNELLWAMEGHVIESAYHNVWSSV